MQILLSRIKKLAKHSAKITKMLHNYSSYAQQLAWNVMLNTDYEVIDEILHPLS